MSETTLTQVFHFLQEYIQSEGYPPNQRELARGCKLPQFTLSEALAKLEAKGKIKRSELKPRLIRIISNATD